MFSSSFSNVSRPFTRNNSSNTLRILLEAFPEATTILDDFDLGGLLELNKGIEKGEDSPITRFSSLQNLFFFIYQDLISNVISIDNYKAERNLYIDCFLDSYFKKISKIRVTDFKEKLGAIKNRRDKEEWIDRHDIKYALNTIDYDASYMKVDFKNMFFSLVKDYVDISKARAKSGIRSFVCVESVRTKRDIESVFINSEIYEFMQLLIINTVKSFSDSGTVLKNNHSLYIPIIEGYIREIEKDMSSMLHTDVDVSIVNLRRATTYDKHTVLVEEYCLDKSSGLLFPVLGRKEDYAVLNISSNYGHKKPH